MPGCLRRALDWVARTLGGTGWVALDPTGVPWHKRLLPGRGDDRMFACPRRAGLLMVHSMPTL
jgi:hypothetical protein